MKKIFILFLLIACTLFVNVNRVHAEEYLDPSTPLVVSVGTDINDYLKYDGYVVVSNTVNTNVAGCYSITYRSIAENVEVKKIVYVISDSNFVLEKEYKSVVSSTSAYGIVKALSTPNGFMYAETFKNPRFVGTSYYLYYETGLSNLIRNNSKCIIGNLNYANGHKLVIGNEYNSADTSFNMLLCDFSEERATTFIIPIDGIEYGTSITSSADIYFIGGYTNEVNDIFANERSGDDSFILFVNKADQSIKRCLMLPANDHDEISDLYFIDNYLYALQNQDNKSLRLLKIDIFGNVVAENIIEHPYGVRDPKLKYQNNRLTLSYGYYDYNHLDYVDTILELDSDLVRKTVYLGYERNLRLVDYEVKDSMQLDAIFSYKNNQPGYVYKFIDDSVTLFDYYNLDALKPLILTQNKVICSTDTGFVINELDTLYVSKAPKSSLNPKTDNVSIVDDYEVYMNGKKLCYLPDSKLYINEELFGKQKLTYHFMDTIDFLMDISLDVLPFVGVEDGKTYDLNTIITGNAKVRVNGELQDLPHCLDEVGEYDLELTGLNNESIKICINVADYSQYEVVEKPNAKIDVELNDTASSKDLNISFQKRTTEVSKNNGYLFVYIIPFICLGVGFLLLKRGH